MKNLMAFIQKERNISMDFTERAKRQRPEGIYLYGAGHHAPYTVDFLTRRGVKIKAILDTYSGRGSLYGIPVINFSDFLASTPDVDSWFVISAPSAQEAIIQTLSARFPTENIFSFETELYTGFIPDLAQYRRYLLDHWDEFTEFCNALSDDKSRETFISVIKGRISGDASYFHQCCDPIQYYTPDIIHFSPGEVMVELGANNGETLLEFMRYCPDYKAAYCFEPGKSCQPILNKIANDPRAKGSIHIIQKGAWSTSTTLRFAVDEDLSAGAHIATDGSEAAGYTIETAAVDDVVREPVTFMKMDIEGAELQALHGAKGQITRNKPKLAVCVYHRPGDFLDIWNYLRELVPEYRFFLRHHAKFAGSETMLYAVAE